MKRAINTKKTSNQSKKEKIIVAVSGYFDPIHTGHIEYLKLAKELGDELVVIVCNDVQTKLKKGYVFMVCEDRKKIVSSLACVDRVFESLDESEDGSVCETLKKVKPHVFAKGGDKKPSDIPEIYFCKKYKIKMVHKLGKKINSSSNLIKNQSEIIKRLNNEIKLEEALGEIRVVKKPWGKEEWIAHNKLYTGKIICINPHQKLSEQYHNTKHETIYVLEGQLKVGLGNKEIVLDTGKSIVISPGTIHRFSATENLVRLFEVSTSQVEDVIRLNDNYGRIK